METWTQSPRYGAREPDQPHAVRIGYSGSPVSLRALKSLQTQEIAFWLRALMGQKHSPTAMLDSHGCRSYQGQTY